MAGPQQPGHCCRDLFGGRSSLHLLGGGGQLLMLMQASVFHVVLALSNMDERMQHKAGAGAVCQLHDTNHGRHLGRTCTARSVRGFGYLVMPDMNRVRTSGSHFW